ncbi:LexA family protein [Thiomicrospira microaerophila]|uniref:LexA family protein n=1 Tax=Thiomicrospira microaerophila TaxID=406020 RepID=UPI0005C9130A|nr:translesion error-prone DNA polymerase V autoproteolytic subunit [Thiomicrospira microaerophila]
MKDKTKSTTGHGGKRQGAGRKAGTGKFGEPTKVIRVPESKVDVIKDWLSVAANQQDAKHLDAKHQDAKHQDANHQVNEEGDKVHYLDLPSFKNAEVFRPDFSTEVQIGLYSHKVVAGFPLPADDNLEQTIDLNTHFIKKPETTFLIKVQGDSMKKAGIYPGDLLAVDRSATPGDGKIVIAAMDGELTVKRLSVKSTGTWLMPENDRYDPIPVREGSDLVIWGVVVSVLRSV